MPSGACRERTHEFNQLVEQVRARTPAKPFPAARPPPRAKSTFSVQSGEIRKYLNATSSKLERLASLASSKSTSLFDDPTAEIEELSFVVKQDIKQLQARVAQLQATVDAKKAGEGNTAEHAKSVIGALQYRLMDTTNGFKEVLQSRANNMKTQHDRRGQYGGAAGQHFGQAAGVSAPGLSQRGGASPGGMFANPYQAGGGVTNPLLASAAAAMDEAEGEDGDDDCVISFPSMDQMQMVPSNSYAESRAVAVENIQKTMVELGEVFQQLNHMIQSQHEMIETIDRNVDDTVDNVEAAQDMWMKYLERISSNRMLAVKIFSILLFFGLFFIIFLK